MRPSGFFEEAVKTENSLFTAVAWSKSSVPDVASAPSTIKSAQYSTMKVHEASDEGVMRSRVVIGGFDGTCFNG